MFHALSFFRSLLWVNLGMILLLVGCSASSRSASNGQASPREKDTLVPQETQRNAEQNYGEQESMMNDLSMTPSEQAGAAHERAVHRSGDSGREQRKNKNK